MVKPVSKPARPQRLRGRGDPKPLFLDLRRAGNAWRTFLDALPLLVSYVDPEHRYVFNNKAYEDWFDCRCDDICGRHVRDVVGEAVYDLIKPKLDQALHGEVVTFDRLNPYRSGERFIRATYVPDFSEDGAARGIFTLIEDLSDLKQAQDELRKSHDTLAEQVRQRTAELCATNTRLLEEVTERRRAEADLASKERLLSELVETAPSLVVVTDGEGRIVLFNRACESLTGYRREEVIGRPVIDMFVPDEWKDIVQRRQTATETEQLRLPHQSPWLTRCGEQRCIEWRYALLPTVEGDGPGVLAIGVDVAERYRAEQLTREQQSELARLLRVNTLGEMASALAHELNQPLSAILGYTQGGLRMMRRGDYVENELEDCLNKAAGQARRAGDIIQHIRRYVRRADPHRTVAGINDLVREAVVLMTAEASTHRIRVRLDLDAAEPKVFAEKIAIEQVILNLFHNSVGALQEAGTPKGCIEIVTRLEKHGTVVVSVRDNGPGVSPDLRDNLFQPFVTAKRDGIGLGLSISRSLVRDHGGDLWYDDEAAGATFRFALPSVALTDNAGQ